MKKLLSVSFIVLPVMLNAAEAGPNGALTEAQKQVTRSAIVQQLQVPEKAVRLRQFIRLAASPQATFILSTAASQIVLSKLNQDGSFDASFGKTQRSERFVISREGLLILTGQTAKDYEHMHLGESSHHKEYPLHIYLSTGVLQPYRTLDYYLNTQGQFFERHNTLYTAEGISTDTEDEEKCTHASLAFKPAPAHVGTAIYDSKGCACCLIL